MRSHLACIASLALSLLVLIGSAAPARCDADLRSIVVLREDDLRDTWRTPHPEFGNVSAFTYCMNNHIPITWAAITNLADAGNHGLTWAELRQYLSVAGGEVASHSLNHVEMATAADYINEVILSKAAVEAGMGSGYVCRSFMEPGGWTGEAYMDKIAKLNNPIGQAVQSTYQNSMAYLGAVWRTGATPYRYGLTNSFSLDYRGCPAVDGVIKMLDIVAGCPGTVMVVSCHGVQPTGGTNAYEIRANVLQAFVEKVVALRAQDKIRLMGYAEANDQVFPQDINQIPSIAVCDPPSEGSAGPWRLMRGACMSPDGGISGGKCLELKANNAVGRCGWLTAPPGRYEVSWCQKTIDGYSANSAVRVGVSSYQGSITDPGVFVQNYPWYYNQVPGNWEQKKALILIKESHIPMIVDFQSNSYDAMAPGCLVDGMSLVLKPVDPGVSPSNAQVVPSPTGGTITWRTPDDPTITAIEVRYGTASHPLDGTSNQLGTQPNTLLVSLAPVLGQTQTIPFTLSWAGKSRVYFSIFAKRGSAYSDPDIDYVMVSTAAPALSITQAPPAVGGQTTVSWSIQSPSAPIYESHYALGASPGAADIKQWTSTTATSTSLHIPGSGRVYVSVKAQTAFGVWSNTETREITREMSIVQAKQGPDNDMIPVTLVGVVSAVFGDYFYIQSLDRTSGIRVTGSGGFVEGQPVCITGTIDTENGERVLRITSAAN